jgi:hypothetical protein
MPYMNHDNDDQRGPLDRLKNKWRTASVLEKVMWLALALLAIGYSYEKKKKWDKERAKRDK